nr:MAG TPA: hypothetical protein [Bacteriophage sp.]
MDLEFLVLQIYLLRWVLNMEVLKLLIYVI